METDGRAVDLGGDCSQSRELQGSGEGQSREQRERQRVQRGQSGNYRGSRGGQSGDHTIEGPEMDRAETTEGPEKGQSGNYRGSREGQSREPQRVPDRVER